MRTLFNIIKFEFIKWIKSDKQLTTAFSLIFLYMYSLEIIKDYSAELGEPINLFEPMSIFLSNFYTIPIIVLTFAVLMIDFPDISANATFLLLRTGRTKWYKSQVLFVLTAAVTFITILFIFTVVLMSNNAFAANVWSNAERFINDVSHSQYRIKNPISYLDLSIINNYTVTTAMIYGVSLMVLYLVLASQLQMALSLRFNKMIGLIGNLLVLGLGMVTWWADGSVKWLFPLAHSTIAYHYDELYNKVEFPIAGSFVYLIAFNTVIYFIGRKVMNDKMLTLMSQGG